jgi:hypothetical protein
MLNDNKKDENIKISIEEINKDTVVAKKRGRKPKGGKIIIKNSEVIDKPPILPNIILHLKCSLNDLNEYNNKISEMISDPLIYKPLAPPEIMAYSDIKEPFSKYDNDKNKKINQVAYKQIEEEPMKCKFCKENESIEKEENIPMKDITNKLKELRIQFYKNTINDKKSACFWCTYDYDNPPYYIPKYEVKDEIGGYGSFCRPECAVAFLMKENIDDSTKFERYHLLNRIYSKVSGYTKNIKPAPNPHFLLDKYFGNLSIQEYRKLSSSAYILLVIDKPLTRILPELHEDNEEFIYNIYGGITEQNNKTGGMYKVKRQSEKEKGPSKTTIMRNSFGITT